MVSQEQKYKERTKSWFKSSVVINTCLVVGLIILITFQLIVFYCTMQQRTRTASAAQDGSSNPTKATSGLTLTSSAIQFVSCSDDDLTHAVAVARYAIVNIDIASTDVGSTSRRGGANLSFDIPPSQALQTNEETLGSGIIVDGRGYILTCYHLIKGYQTTYVTVFSADRKVYKAQVVETDIANDLALLRIYSDSPFPAAKLANSDMVKITDTVLTIGSPFGFEHTVTAGIVSDNKRSIVIDGTTYRDVFQTDAAVNRGSAGGALINSEGEVIGVNTAIASTSEYFAGVSFAIPINKARALLLKAIEG